MANRARSWRACRVAAAFLSFLVAITLTVAAVVAADDDDEPQFLPGLVARYEANGIDCIRRDEAVQFVWKGRSPDERLPAGDFSARWQGQLLVMSPGQHRFYLHAAGEVSLEVAGKQVVAGEGDTPQWFESPSIDLEFGQHAVAIGFKKTSDQARVGLYWSGPQFELEPVPNRLLFHDPASDPGNAFERGAELWRALRCANCHRRSEEPGGMAAASLANLNGNLSRTWLIDWLQRGSTSTGDFDLPHPGPGYQLAGAERDGIPLRMPQFRLDERDARAAADYLFGPQQNDDAARDLPAGNVRRGEKLFLTLGCLGCHQCCELGTAGLFAGGDLSRVAEKRPANFFARWLADPANINPSHRMPVFRLSDSERGDLTTWLATLQRADAAPGEEETPPSVKPGSARPASGLHGPDRGQRIVEDLRCGACHALPGVVSARVNIALNVDRAKGHWQETCLAAPDRQKSRPGYALSAEKRDALVTYLTGRRNSESADDGLYVLRERNCLGCHARDAAEGIASQLTGVIERHSQLASILPTLIPPSLTAVGDKLHDAALADAILLRNPPLRPWLAIRMPRFTLTEADLTTLTDYFSTIDRIPDRPRREPQLEAKELVAAGSRLVTSAGFGCTSCHKIGSSAPVNVALAARGNDLSQVGKRVRHEWFNRWVRNPARIVPRMEMPSIQIPARGVLGEKLDGQLAAVWHVLNTPGFEPPTAGPIRVAWHPGDASPPIVISDIVETDKRVIVRPMMIGLRNRQNVLFDLGANRLVAWWHGDTANQQTRGKSWYWEPAGANLLAGMAVDGTELEIFDGDWRLEPTPMAGSSLAELDWYQSESDSIAFGYRLRFEDEKRPVIARVVQQIRPIDDGRSRGFRRQWEIEGVPDLLTLLLRLPADGTNYRLQVDSPQILDGGDTHTVRLPPIAVGQPIICKVSYLTRAEALPTNQPATLPAAEPAAKLAVVPGYDALRLPLPRSEMPTGLAWRDDGTLVMCSLKGSVWLVRDTDGDGLEDHLELVADGLAAPYGVACRGAAIDVATKFGVIRLSQLRADGRARRADVIASGWGYTADYHDWTVGLPRDAEGNYFVGLPCQQDDRSLVEARLRGTVVKLRPRQPTIESPRLFDLEMISAGLRFPMGLAVNRDGDVFATDNQGNYTPFNELNHLRRGARYGFVNKLEARPGFQPPCDDPAIAIPHPWTRSVNGICFLYTPDAVREQKRPSFGPFEGHLIGCEFDTRRLIRMSLKKVGETYQGAAYPFSTEPVPGEPTFEGPVVCAVAPQGDLYVGNLRDSGWGGGQNTGSIVRLRPVGAVPVGIAQIHALADGFAIDFTASADPDRAKNPANYAIRSYRRIATPAYGSPDVDRENESVTAVELSPDARRATLRLKRMRPGFVYEFQIKSLAVGNRLFFPAEAFYTFRKLRTAATTLDR
jgi:mono/diheme cytochrome c family protein